MAYNISKRESKISGKKRVKTPNQPSMAVASQAPVSDFLQGSNATFTFDQTPYQQAYQQQADSIYNPQIASLGTQAETQKVTTKQQFADLLKNTIESTNRRGAFFSGGALANEGKINTDQTAALQGIDTSLAQNRAEVEAKKSEYVTSGIESAKSGAYKQFQDQLDNAMKMYKMQQDTTLAQQRLAQQESAARQRQQITPYQQANLALAKEKFAFAQTKKPKGKAQKKVTYQDVLSGTDNWDVAASNAKAAGIPTYKGSQFDVAANKRWNPKPAKSSKRAA